MVKANIGRKKEKDPLPEVSDREVSMLAKKLLVSLEGNKKNQISQSAIKVLDYPGVREVLSLLAAGSVLVLALSAPGALVVAKSLLDEKSDRDWKKFNRWYLDRTLKRLKKSKMINFDYQGDKVIVELSRLGKKKILKYSLEEMKIKRPVRWDKKWRLVIYDVPNSKRKSASCFGNMLISLGMHRMQKSVFICPFPCRNEIEFLREYYRVREHVWMLTVSKFEDDFVFRKFFGL